MIGATKSVYAPEPCDVGRILQAEISANDQTTTVATSGPVDPGLSVLPFVFLKFGDSRLLETYLVFRLQQQD